MLDWAVASGCQKVACFETFANNQTPPACHDMVSNNRSSNTMTETMMCTNDNEHPAGPRPEPLHLFEISFATWGLPVTVIAEDFTAAIDLAVEHQGGKPNARSVMVWDASDAWSDLCQIRQDHTDQALAEGIVGIAQYDDEEGWSVTPNRPA
jgi:hypothetical protein